MKVKHILFVVIGIWWIWSWFTFFKSFREYEYNEEFTSTEYISQKLGFIGEAGLVFSIGMALAAIALFFIFNWDTKLF